MDFGPLHPITKEAFEQYAKDMPHALVISIYCISKYHEKYNVTAWCKSELSRRGFTDKDMKDFDDQLENFYQQLLEQTDL